jgi:PAS domain-containing protein
MEKEVGLLQPIATDIRQGRSRAGIAFGELSPARLKEASAAIETWRHLKQRKAQGDNSVQAIAQLLRYLGFILDPGTVTTLQREQRGGDWVQVRAPMSADSMAFAIPQLGSQAQRRCDVACVWQRPGVDTLSTWLRDAPHEAHSAIVLYLGRLTARQRRDLMLKARDQDLALMVLDETLLVFLAGERDSRLAVFLGCTLPFAALNPYALPQTGEVPPEMFFGRQALTHDLQRLEGSCLAYGGRQTGKTALLHHVQREFHHPAREQYAWVESLKSVASVPTGSPTQAVWLKLRDGCKAIGMLAPKVTTDKPEEIARYIAEALRTTPERRVLVLCDDADQFLEADAKDRFRVVEGLRKLMVDTQRRFKVVFAGSQYIQRFHKLPYQPLAPCGDPLVVGPLEPEAARQLVSKPFAALGYRFAEATALLRILSYTNYHPALIQLFCHELLSKLQERASGDPPPYLVNPTDVEEVYRSRKVREGIREQFDSTLALDARYQVLTWTMLVQQQQAGDGYPHLYTPGVLWQVAQPWWPRGVNHAGEDQVRDLLEELCGLGVLSRTVDGQYRLCNPNLLRLLGTDFEDRLLKLAQA